VIRTEASDILKAVLDRVPKCRVPISLFYNLAEVTLGREVHSIAQPARTLAHPTRPASKRRHVTGMLCPSSFTDVTLASVAELTYDGSVTPACRGARYAM